MVMNHKSVTQNYNCCQVTVGNDASQDAKELEPNFLKKNMMTCRLLNLQLLSYSCSNTHWNYIGSKAYVAYVY